MSLKCPDCGGTYIGIDDEEDPIRYWCMICGLECSEEDNLFDTSR